MRLHTDKITGLDIYNAAKDLPGVVVAYTDHGSRSHDHAFEVRLEGNGTRAGYATKDHQGATWDEWGVFIARLYQVDPNALWGSAKHPVYDGADNFHYLTADRFYDGTMPTDTHPRHKWEYQGGYQNFACKKCSAEKQGY